MRVQLPGGAHPGRVDAEQPFHHGHAGKRRESEAPSRPGRRTPSLKDPMTLLAVEGGEVEVAGQLQGIEFDSVLERVARKPHRSRAQHREAVTKTWP